MNRGKTTLSYKIDEMADNLDVIIQNYHNSTKSSELVQFTSGEELSEFRQ